MVKLPLALLPFLHPVQTPDVAIPFPTILPSDLFLSMYTENV